MSTFIHGGAVHANGIRQHYLRYGGKGPAIVLLPGITSPAITWGFVAERLGETCDVYVVDARGRGLSEARQDLSYDLETYADDVLAFVQAVGLDEWLLLGHSMGGRTGLTVGPRQPAGLKAMVLVDPPLSGPGRRTYNMSLDWYIDSIRLSAKGCDHEAMRPFLPAWSDEALQLRAEWLHTCDIKAVTDSFHFLRSEDVVTHVGRINVPVLLMIAGAVDVIRLEEAEELAAMLPGLRTETVAKAGHMIPWEEPEGFFTALTPFLREVVANEFIK